MKKAFLFILFFLTHLNLFAQQYAWTQKANYGGGAVYDAFSFVVNGQAYAGTGIDSALNYRNDFSPASMFTFGR